MVDNADSLLYWPPFSDFPCSTRINDGGTKPKVRSSETFVGFEGLCLSSFDLPFGLSFVPASPPEGVS